MAYVKRHPIKATLYKAIKYIENKEKTDEKILIATYKCSSNKKLAIIEMNALKKQYDKEDGILGFHFVQSFKPGETDKETAHQIGKEWADIFLGNHQYILSTHVDKGHIHNHIIINSVGLDGKKYNSCINEREDIRAYSDVICRKYSLSIINNKYQNRTMSYKEWLENKNKTSWKQKTKDDINFYISKSNSFEDFVQKMKNDGYEIKYGDNVKYMTFKSSNMQKCVRGKTLGSDYTEESIRNKILLKDNEIGTFRSRQYKYRTRKDKWDYVFKMVSYNHSSLEVNVLLISILLSVIFNKNENYQSHKRYYESQKIISKEIDNLSDKLNLINKYNLKTRGDIDVAIENINDAIQEKQQVFNRLEELDVKADAVCTEIQLYNKYKNYNIEYSSSLLKGAYRKKHEYELEKFESCKQRLKKFGLEAEEDYVKFENSRNDIIEKMEVVKEQIYKDYSNLEQIEGIKTTLDAERRKQILQDVIIERNNEEKEKSK